MIGNDNAKIKTYDTINTDVLTMFIGIKKVERYYHKFRKRCSANRINNPKIQLCPQQQGHSKNTYFAEPKWAMYDGKYNGDNVISYISSNRVVSLSTWAYVIPRSRVVWCYRALTGQKCREVEHWPRAMDGGKHNWLEHYYLLS